MEHIMCQHILERFGSTKPKQSKYNNSLFEGWSFVYGSKTGMHPSAMIWMSGSVGSRAAIQKAFKGHLNRREDPMVPRCLLESSQEVRGNCHRPMQSMQNPCSMYITEPGFSCECFAYGMLWDGPINHTSHPTPSSKSFLVALDEGHGSWSCRRWQARVE